MKYIDIEIALIFQTIDDAYKTLFKLITTFGEFWFVSLIVVVSYFFVQKRDFYFLSLAFIFTKIISSSLKFIFGKSRVELFYKDDIYQFSPFNFDYNYQSMPSGHTSSAFFLFFAFGYLFPRYRIYLFMLALSVGFSRIALHKHYLSDILAGILVAYIGFYGAKKLILR